MTEVNVTKQISDLLDEGNGALPARTLPGLYPLVYVDGMGEKLCASCAQAELDSERASMPDMAHWLPQSYYEHLHGFAVKCGECGTHIPSAYGLEG